MDVSVYQPSAWSDLVGGSTSMDVDVDRCEAIPGCACRETLPERLFSNVELVKRYLRGSLLDTTFIVLLAHTNI